MPEHTPGPYHADHSGERIAIWALGDKRVFLGACSEKGIGRREAEANAALFVASPDLLAQLESAVNLLESINGRRLGNGIIVNYDRDLPAMHAAIAKARV